MPNIKFSYLYRDAANYKSYGYVVMSNPANKSLKEIEASIREKLINNEWFYANEWQLPDLYPPTINPCDDPSWHEFESTAFIDEPVNFHHVLLM
jgi:hypothetical protein